MKCMYLVKRTNLSCRALERPYAPSLFQLTEYCRSTAYRKCPFYLQGIISANQREDSVGQRRRKKCSMTSFCR
ncbi:MAG: hypothetical protein P8013_05710 [Candidatus Sulfobium sp.]|jgi:hypothetical protein